MSLPQFTTLQIGRIAFLAGLGDTAEDIAADTLVTARPDQITFLVDRLGLPPLAKQGTPRSFPVSLPVELSLAIERAAAARNMTRGQLAQRILIEVLAAQLVGAVLKDGVPG